MQDGGTIPCPHCRRTMRVRKSPKGALVAKCDDCPLQVLLFTKMHISEGCPGCEPAPEPAPTRRSQL